MELFHECKNRYFRLIFLILSLAKEGLSKEEVIKLIEDGEYDEKVIGKDFKTFKGLLLNEYNQDENFNLLMANDELFYPVINHEPDQILPVRLTVVEKQWIKRLIDEPMVKVLLGESLVQKLEQSLSDVNCIGNINMIERTYTANNDISIDYSKFHDDFHTILKGIVENKPIRYSNVDKWGNRYENKLSLPIRIEYSLRDDRFRVSMYSLEENRPIMVNLHTIEQLELVHDMKPNIDREEVFKLLKEKKYAKEPIILEVTDERAAMERCFMCFSGFERSSRTLGENKYEIKLNYYTFEEDDVIRKLIALGPFVKVISPQRVIDVIVSKIKKAMEM
ncbi:WYL domain-containing protein [Oceanirhabdus sp. W0125-5]|uniref:WYL domain-containing protein n=1 Tax=Oceanirhabdus sp. W0125-5 TaxID=2999116 RepID=UPI0022F3163F|nr:WYL domain-containing protein [Oceanirhabdus sp. W0125-5]WBW98625.1 WYL domain-containing protein [Oceanirhabdus sp. W0125-5]